MAEQNGKSLGLNSTAAVAISAAFTIVLILAVWGFGAGMTCTNSNHCSSQLCPPCERLTLSLWGLMVLLAAAAVVTVVTRRGSPGRRMALFTVANLGVLALTYITIRRWG